MEKAISEIIARIRAGQTVDSKALDLIVRQRNRQMHDATRHVAKRRLMSYYLFQRAQQSDVWKGWDIDPETDEALVGILKAKPRRTASGVATITVLTAPWPCGSDCIYCPNDIRMPKSYMSEEPACQRAERNFFDPYLQVVSRLRVLQDMGHVTDKVELIVLGGTWSDYPDSYRVWFVSEMFRALNEAGSVESGGEGSLCSEGAGDSYDGIRRIYEEAGFESSPDALALAADEVQARIDSHSIGYNAAFDELYGHAGIRVPASRGLLPADSIASAFVRLSELHAENESSRHRVVGLVFETRPDNVDAEELAFLRRLGATKVQMGIQSLDDGILEANGRHIGEDAVARAFSLLRAFGFKTHVHFMVNLLGATPDFDKAQYLRLVEDPRFIPDEVKLYPCALVQSAHLMEYYEQGRWSPYSDSELMDVLTGALKATPPYTRISRMIRDISAKDIVVGNKKTNLRQMVENSVIASGAHVDEMRMREIATKEVSAEEISMECVEYPTSGSDEIFIQWIGDKGELAAFCRLSLPKADNFPETDPLMAEAGLSDGAAMIREVHVYGKVSRLHEAREGVQHLGLGRQMVEYACSLASERGYTSINVISAVGTREYYRSLGFSDGTLYQWKRL